MFFGWFSFFSRPCKIPQRRPIEEVHAEFAKAARHVMKSFTMAYDGNDPDFQGENADLSCVSETIAIEGMNWAIMSTDFELAAQLAACYRTRPDGYMLALDTNRYTHSLALTIQGRQKEALPLLTTQFEDYKKNPPRAQVTRTTTPSSSPCSASW